MNDDTRLQYDAILPAIRLGFAKAASEAGLTPSEAEAKLAGMNKEGLGTLDAILQLLTEQGPMAVMAGGAIAGGLSGIARHKLERRAEGKDDPQLTADELKAQGYERMSEDLRRQMAATAPEFTAPRVQEAMR